MRECMEEAQRGPLREDSDESLKSKIRRMKEIQAEYTASYCLDMRNFSDTYSPEVIEADSQYVVNVQEAIERKNEETGYTLKQDEVFERAKTMEKIVPVQGELSEWFGSYAVIVKATEYDDVRNGTDFVIEFNVPDSEELSIDGGIRRLAIAVDATTSQETRVVKNKIERGLDKVQSGGGVVKYFDSQLEDFKGQLENVVPVTIGIEARNIYGLIDNVFEYIRLGKIQSKDRTPVQQAKFQEARRNVEQSPAQMVFLREMSLQLGMYAKKLEGIRAREDIREQIIALKTIIDSIFEEKYETGMDLGFMVNDKTLKLIESITRDA